MTRNGFITFDMAFMKEKIDTTTLELLKLERHNKIEHFFMTRACVFKI